MSKWLDDGEVLVGQGSGEALPVSPRLRSLPPGSPRPGRGRSPLVSPRGREAMPLSPPKEAMGKAKELFVLCDKEGKGFITKRDMQSLQGELPLSPEQLETVFDSLDRESNGFLTPAEFKAGLGELLGLDQTTELSQDEADEDVDETDWSQDPTAGTFVNILMELGADKLFKDQQELRSLWCDLQRDRPELLSVLEGVLVQAVSHLQDALRERDSMEQALRRRESEHDQVVRSIYEDMETQIKEEREKYVAQDSIKQKQRGHQLEEDLKMREQELENTLSKQKELETRIRQLSSEQGNIKEQNEQLRRLNFQLHEQVESSREQLHVALSKLNMLQNHAAQEQVDRQRFRSITEQYYRKADGILAMYDVTQSASFTAVRGWMDSVKEKMCEGSVLMLLGNKLDLADRRSREVSTGDGQKLAEQHQALFYECSAKTGCNMEELMTHLAGMLVSQNDRQCEDALLLTEDTVQRTCCT
uniref:small monomeric GTPase n=1 Tax=Acanthochromis polyacanthus TaxID=80966 RepID=A0A3Q1EU45_9TELE